MPFDKKLQIIWVKACLKEKGPAHCLLDCVKSHWRADAREILLQMHEILQFASDIADCILVCYGNSSKDPFPFSVSSPTAFKSSFLFLQQADQLILIPLEDEWRIFESRARFGCKQWHLIHKNDDIGSWFLMFIRLFLSVQDMCVLNVLIYCKNWPTWIAVEKDLENCNKKLLSSISTELKSKFAIALNAKIEIFRSHVQRYDLIKC